jgi:hypothetical protein
MLAISWLNTPYNIKRTPNNHVVTLEKNEKNNRKHHKKESISKLKIKYLHRLHTKEMKKTKTRQIC